MKKLHPHLLGVWSKDFRDEICENCNIRKFSYFVNEVKNDCGCEMKFVMCKDIGRTNVETHGICRVLPNVSEVANVCAH